MKILHNQMAAVKVIWMQSLFGTILSTISGNICP